MENHKVEEISIEYIDEPQFAMRSEIDRDEVFELANDIKKNGLINPITVRPKGERYEVVAGHRRFLAHRYGGIVKIKCVIRELTDAEAFGVMTSENLVREDVNPIDEATHTKRLLDMNENNIERVCDILNRSREWVKARLIVAEMSEEMKDALKTGKIKLGVALALAEITDATDQSACLGMAISQGASVVVAQYWVAQWRAGLFGHATEKMLPDPDAPGYEKKVIMLKCSVDGKEYPAHDFVSVLVARQNIGYIEAMKQHLQSEPSPVIEETRADVLVSPL